MAGAGYKLFNTGDVLTAADVNTYLQEQTVMVFASAAARTTALTGVLAEGMVTYLKDTDVVQSYNGTSWVTVGTDANNVTLTGTQTLTNKTLSVPIVIAPEERTTVSATAATGTINYDSLTQGVLFYTTNATANFTLNFRGNSTTTLNSSLVTGDAVSLVFLNTNGATAYYPTAFQIDGSAVTPKWSGGTAPTSGNASSIDAYSFTIIKTASTPTYTVLAGTARFA